MSVGLRLAADLRQREFSGTDEQPVWSVVFDDVMTAVWEAVRAIDSGFVEFLSEAREEQELLVQVVPGPEPLRFEYESGSLIVTANTTASGGPGYHAYVVGVLDGLAESMGFQWRSDGTDLFDETGYFEDRHFEAVQAEMLAWFRQVAGVVLKHAREGATGLCLSLSIESPPVGDWFAAGPLGPLSLEELERVGRGDTAEVEAVARRFFPWWERGISASSLRGIALVQAWSTLLWVPPRNDDERTTCEGVLRLFERARAEDPEIQLPEAEIAELRTLLEPEAPWKRPPSEGIGYRRGEVRHTLAGGWSLSAPGYLAIEWDDGTWTGASGERTIHATTFSWSGEEADGGRNFVTHFEDEASARRVEEMPGDLYAMVWPLVDDRAKTGCGAAIGTSGSGCLLSLFSGIEGDEAWAESVVRSVRLSGGEPN